MKNIFKNFLFATTLIHLSSGLPLIFASEDSEIQIQDPFKEHKETLQALREHNLEDYSGYMAQSAEKRMEINDLLNMALVFTTIDLPDELSAIPYYTVEKIDLFKATIQETINLYKIFMRIDNEQAQHQDQTERNFAIENQKLLWDYISHTNVFTNQNNPDYLEFRLFISQELKKPEIIQETLTTIFQQPTKNVLDRTIKLIAHTLQEVNYPEYNTQSLLEIYFKNFITTNFEELLRKTDFSVTHYKAFADNLDILIRTPALSKIIIEKAAKDMFHTSEKRQHNPTLFLNMYTEAKINETTENSDEDLEEITENLEEAGEEY